MIQMIVHLSTGRTIPTTEVPKPVTVEDNGHFQRWLVFSDVTGRLWKIRPDHVVALESHGDQEDQPASEPS